MAKAGCLAHAQLQALVFDAQYVLCGRLPLALPHGVEGIQELVGREPKATLNLFLEPPPAVKLGVLEHGPYGGSQHDGRQLAQVASLQVLHREAWRKAI